MSDDLGLLHLMLRRLSRTTSIECLFVDLDRLLDGWDVFDLMVRRLSRTLPDALRPRSHGLTDPCVRETIPGEVI